MSNVRIISQDGTVDVPYENCSVYINRLNEKEICAQCLGDESNFFSVALYSTPEKAKEAMEELKYAYLSHNHLKLDKKVPKNVSPNILEGVFGVFQFPKDDEVEA